MFTATLTALSFLFLAGDACTALTTACVAATSYDPKVDAPITMVAGAELDKAAVSVAPKLEDYTWEHGTSIDFIGGRFVVNPTIAIGHSSDPRYPDRSDVGQIVYIDTINDQTVALVHSHPDAPIYDGVPSCISPGVGDHMAIRFGLLPYVTRTGVLMVMEQVHGQYRVRVVSAKRPVTQVEYQRMKEAADCAQLDSRRPLPQVQ